MPSSREYIATNRARINAVRNAYRARVGDPHKRKHYLKHTYGITLEQFDAYMLTQNGVCGICGNPPPIGKHLCVDHCHVTGKVRGLLCSDCNLGIGKLRDNPDLLRKAALWVS